MPTSLLRRRNVTRGAPGHWTRSPRHALRRTLGRPMFDLSQLSIINNRCLGAAGSQGGALPAHRRRLQAPQAHEVSICQATSTNFLATLDASCCRDQDCTTLPDPCTPECASSYMPFFSRCGTTVFGTSDALLAQFTDFNTKCAASTGRNTHTGPRTHLRGPDANDVCSATTDCNGCAGSCGGR